MPAADLTIAIVAHNAAGTIERAIASAVKTGPYPILLIDDHSTDRTAELAKQAGGKQVIIIQSAGKHCVGAARQTALEHITTPYGLWLDADDTILPERPEIFLKALHEGNNDLVYGEGYLVNDISGEKIPLFIPNFMNKAAYMPRNLERNWLPLLHCGFRSDFARRVGYDTSFECAEDYDFFLRSLLHGGHIHCVKGHHYLYYHRPRTISRDLSKTRHHIELALDKLVETDWSKLFSRAALSETEQAFITGSSLLYRGHYKRATHYLAPLTDYPEILPQYNRSISWCSCFLLATSHWMAGEWQAAKRQLMTLTAANIFPEAVNNLACCHMQVGDKKKATILLREAITLYPAYTDAKNNLSNMSSDHPHYTSHPLRIQKGRDAYE